MPCRSPVRQYWKTGGEWTLNPDSADFVKAHRDLPCGVCLDCRIRRQREWSIRAYHESQLHRDSCWLTLTFADNPVTLSRKPYQLFFRALRKAGYKFSYFGCGEYGEKLARPHFHICMFGVTFMHDAYPWRLKNGVMYYRSPTLEKYWTLGNSELCPLAPGAAQYTAGYTTKKIGGDLADEINPETGLRHYEKIHPHTGEIIELEPEFVLVSTKPAIGKRWLEKNYREIYPADSVVMNGKEYPVPRKYDEWLKNELDPDLWEIVQAKRLQHIKDNPITEEERAYKAKARDANRRLHDRAFGQETPARN